MTYLEELQQAHKERMARLSVPQVAVAHKPIEEMKAIPIVDGLQWGRKILKRKRRRDWIKVGTGRFKIAESEVIGPCEHPPVRGIISIVADHFNISLCDICSQRRTWNIVRPRQIAMYLAKKLTLYSLPQIGRFIGDKDHTTVLHAVRKIKDLRLAQPALDADIMEIEEAIAKEYPSVRDA